jgi:hypothetical protein
VGIAQHLGSSISAIIRMSSKIYKHNIEMREGLADWPTTLDCNWKGMDEQI